MCPVVPIEASRGPARCAPVRFAPPLADRSCLRAEVPRGDVRVCRDPRVAGRHVPVDVGPQERGQGVHVVALEGIDVTRQECPSGLVHGLGWRVREVGGCERGTRTLEGAVDGRGGRVQQLRDLRG